MAAYLALALSDAAWPDQDQEIVAEVGHLGLSQVPCVLFSQGGSCVSLAYVHGSADGEMTSIYYMTEPDVVASVERLGICPGRRAGHLGPLTSM